MRIYFANRSRRERNYVCQVSSPVSTTSITVAYAALYDASFGHLCIVFCVGRHMLESVLESTLAVEFFRTLSTRQCLGSRILTAAALGS